MARTQIRGISQILTSTVENGNILDSTIELIKLAEGSKLLKQDATDNNSYDANSYKIKNLADGTLDTDAATFGQVKSVLNSGSTFLKLPCKATSVFEITDLNSVSQASVDMADLEISDRVLIKNFDSDMTKNGIYIVDFKSGDVDDYVYSLVRSDDADEDSELEKGTIVWVTDGETLAGNQFLILGSDTNTNGTINIGIDEIIFQRTTGLGMVQVGLGLSKNPTDITDELVLIFNPTGGVTADIEGIKIDSTTFYAGCIANEIPAGLINGSNTEFIISNDIVENSEIVIFNGLIIEKNQDYTINYETKTITMITTPVTNDKLRVMYYKK